MSLKIARAATTTSGNDSLRPHRITSPRSSGRAIALAGAVAAAFGGPTAVVAQQEPSRLEQVIVTASIVETPRRQVGAAVSVLEADDIELRGYDSIADVLRTQPSIGVSNSGGLGKSTTLRIRGEEAYRTLLMIDGVRAVDPTGPQVAPGFDSLMTTLDLARIEILRGPQGFIYGADAGGVVNVMTQRGTGDIGGQLSLETGSFGTRRIDGSVSGGADRGDYFVSVSDLRSDGFNARPSDTVLRDDDGASNTTVHAKLGWNVSDKLRLQLVARDIDASTEYDSCFDTITFAPLDDCTGTTKQTTFRVSADHATDRFLNSLAYSEVDIFRDNLSAGISAFSSDGELSRFEYTGSFSPNHSTTIVYGADLQTEKDRSAADLQRHQDGYYVEYQGGFADHFFVSVGARYDDNEAFGSHTSTRVSGAYVQSLASGATLRYRTSYGTGFRAPSLFEIAYNDRPFGVHPAAAATTLREETSRGYDAGLEFDAVGGLHAEATWFDHVIGDQLVYVFDLATFEDGYIQSTGTSSSTGVELAVDAPLNRSLNVLFNWTHNDTEESNGSARLLRPDNLANLGLMFATATQKLRLLANLRFSDDSLDFGGERIPGYELLDVSMSLALGETLELRARIENLTDAAYREVNGYATAGRAAYAGVKLRF